MHVCYRSVLSHEGGPPSSAERVSVYYFNKFCPPAWEFSTLVLSKKPRGLLVINLDDASRNMALCMGQGGMSAASDAMRGKVSEGNNKLLLVQTCQDASTLLYTVSESAGSMYQKFLLANASLQDEAARLTKVCGDIMKKQALQPVKK